MSKILYCLLIVASLINIGFRVTIELDYLRTHGFSVMTYKQAEWIAFKQQPLGWILLVCLWALVLIERKKGEKA